MSFPGEKGPHLKQLHFSLRCRFIPRAEEKRSNANSAWGLSAPLLVCSLVFLYLENHCPCRAAADLFFFESVCVPTKFKSFCRYLWESTNKLSPGNSVFRIYHLLTLAWLSSALACTGPSGPACLVGQIRPAKFHPQQLKLSCAAPDCQHCWNHLWPCGF